MSDSIGQQLAAARQSRGWEVEDIAHKTRIHHDVVRQLEADDYSHFPNMMFAKSFLQIYSQHVGVDATEEIDQLSDAEPNGEGEQYLLGGIKPDVRSQFGRLNIRIPMRPVLATVAAITVLGVSGFYLVSELYGASTNVTEESSETGTGEFEAEAEGRPLTEEPADGEPSEQLEDPTELVGIPEERETPRAFPVDPPISTEPDEIPIEAPSTKIPLKAIAVDAEGNPIETQDEEESDSIPLAVSEGQDTIVDVD